MKAEEDKEEKEGRSVPSRARREEGAGLIGAGRRAMSGGAGMPPAFPSGTRTNVITKRPCKIWALYSGHCDEKSLAPKSIDVDTPQFKAKIIVLVIPF